MGPDIVFDIETNGIDNPTTIHCIALRDAHTGECRSFGPREINDGIEILRSGSRLIGHNIIGYDLPVLRRLANFTPRPDQQVFDTIIAARVIWPRDILVDKDFKNPNLKKLIGSYSLKAWGIRLGNYKGDYGEAAGETAWDEWSPQMQAYCEQDTDVTLTLYRKIVEQNWSEASLDLEHKVAFIIQKQRERGFLFNREKAIALYAKLSAKREALRQELSALFPPWEVVEKVFVAKVNNAKLGYVKGQTVTKMKTVSFNPASRQHVAKMLKDRHGWVPTEFTDKGEAKIDEEVLSTLPYPEAAKLAEYFMVEKRIGQLAEGKEAWLHHFKEDGRIHGGVITNGAMTGRMTHHSPNMTQVPSVRKPYGAECRDLFTCPDGYSLVGADADALELRCLAGYMAKWDGGEYIKTVLEGDKSKGTDIHSVNCRALGFDPKGVIKEGTKDTWRDVAKTWFYAFIYGAGDYKLGSIIGVTGSERDIVAAGKATRERFLRGLPALGALTKAVQDTFTKRGYLIGLDGRRLYPRRKGAALNTLLQSAGAILMKMGAVKADELLSGPKNWDWGFVANIHDEYQAEVTEDYAEDVGKTFVQAMALAGEHFNFPCPITGNYVVGKTWADTH